MSRFLTVLLSSTAPMGFHRWPRAREATHLDPIQQVAPKRHTWARTILLAVSVVAAAVATQVLGPVYTPRGAPGSPAYIVVPYLACLAWAVCGLGWLLITRGPVACMWAWQKAGRRSS